MNTQLIAQHMGQLHAYEQYLVLAVAFGPFVVLGVVLFWIKRRDRAEEDADEAAADQVSATHPRAT